MEAHANNDNRRWIILMVIVMVTFMSTLDGSIVNVALPVMTAALGVTTAQIQMVVTSYLIVIVATILIFGRLGDILGKTRVFTWGLVLFTLGSLLCGVTDSLLFLVLARVLQAIGAAGCMANNQGIITETFPPNERGRALGLSGSSVALGSLTGPALGGFIVQVTSWKVIFLINVPIGLITLFLAAKLLPKGHARPKGRLDGWGALMFMFFVVPLFASLGAGQTLGFSNPLVLTGFAAAALAFILFFRIELHREQPLLQLDIFKNRLFSLSIFCGFISFVALFCTNIIQPFYLQRVMGFSPAHAGLLMMIYPLILTVVAPVSGHLSDKIGSEILTFIGLLMTSLGLLLMSMLNESSSQPVMALCIATMSLGNGLFQSPNNSLIMSTVPRDKLGVAGSINGLIRNTGMVVGIALSTTLLYNRMSARIGYRVSDFVVGRNDAFIYGMRTVYLTATVICLLGAFLTWRRLSAKKARQLSNEA